MLPIPIPPAPPQEPAVVLVATEMRQHGPSLPLLERSTVYQEFLAELNEILRHKWLESEKAGHDIGFERALLDWVRHHRAGWKRSR